MTVITRRVLKGGARGRNAPHCIGNEGARLSQGPLELHVYNPPNERALLLLVMSHAKNLRSSGVTQCFCTLISHKTLTHSSAFRSGCQHGWSAATSVYHERKYSDVPV